MKKRVLVIGGTYFAGRVFTMLASGRTEEYELTLLNRGKYSMKNFCPVQECVCDRHDKAGLRALPLEGTFDAVVDFCAYEPEDISILASNLPCSFKQYIYVSTADVLAPSVNMRSDTSQELQLPALDAVGMYTWKKLLLEKELEKEAKKGGFLFTCVRPAFIYGPYNYAPRESWYVKMIVSGAEVPYPKDAEGRFNMVYVADLARAIMCIADRPEISGGKKYIVSAPEEWTYESYMDMLRKVSGQDFPVREVTADQAMRERIPLPFPLTAYENELFDGTAITEELGLNYSDPMESMQKAYNAFASVFGKR